VVKHTCPRCHEPIEDKAYILAGGKRYHVHCYVGQAQKVCAWCTGIILHGDPRLRVSHGICPECLEKELEDDGFCQAADVVSGYGKVN